MFIGVDKFSGKEGSYEPRIANICSSWELGPLAWKRGRSEERRVGKEC